MVEFIKKLAILITISFLLLNSCDLELKSGNTGPGNLILVLENDFISRTLTPDKNMQISSYRILGNGPNSATFSVETTETTLLQQRLTPGQWTIMVEGLNSENQIIANGNATIEILLNQTTEAEITISLLSGFGSLEFDVSWPAENVITPAIESELISTAGTTTILTASTFSGVDGTAYYNISNLVTGYYTLSIRLMDGDQLVMGSVEMVWIAENTVTMGNFTFAGLNESQGSIEIGISSERLSTIPVTFSGCEAQLPENQTMHLVTDVPGAPEDYLYFWYINGQNVSTTPDLSILGSDYGMGNYQIDLTVFTLDLSRGGSSSSQFKITEDSTPPAVISLTPAANELDVDIEESIVAHFSKPMDVSTISDSTVILKKENVSIPSTKLLSEDGTVLTINPTELLEYETEYQVFLSTEITNTAGYSMVSDYTSTFTTRPNITGSVGPTELIETNLVNWGISKQNHLSFSITKSFTIDSLKLSVGSIYNSGGLSRIGVEILDEYGNSFSPEKVFISDMRYVSVLQANSLIEYQFSNMKINLDWGQNLRMRLVFVENNNANMAYVFSASGANYPYDSSPSGIVTITGCNGSGLECYMYFYDWQISNIH